MASDVNQQKVILQFTKYPVASCAVFVDRIMEKYKKRKKGKQKKNKIKRNFKGTAVCVLHAKCGPENKRDLKHHYGLTHNHIVIRF